jgi:hypothetical protein
MSLSISTVTIHTLNILIGVVGITILSLVARSVITTNSLPNSYPQEVKDTGRPRLFWPGVGGIVNMLLFEFLWFLTPSSEHGLVRVVSSIAETNANCEQNRKRRMY